MWSNLFRTSHYPVCSLRTACGLDGGTGIPKLTVGTNQGIKSQMSHAFYIVYSQKGKEVIVVSPWVSRVKISTHELQLSTQVAMGVDVALHQ